MRIITYSDLHLEFGPAMKGDMMLASVSLGAVNALFS